MKSRESVQELCGLISKHIPILQELFDYAATLKSEAIDIQAKTRTQALAVAGLVENYYTCLETIFLRISQFFENNLPPEKWHTRLLEKMTLDIPGVRPAVITDTTCQLLLELLRFRHFKRYYFQLNYDWDRLEYVLKKLFEAHVLVIRDLEEFRQVLNKVDS